MYFTSKYKTEVQKLCFKRGLKELRINILKQPVHLKG